MNRVASACRKSSRVAASIISMLRRMVLEQSAARGLYVTLSATPAMMASNLLAPASVRSCSGPGRVGKRP